MDETVETLNNKLKETQKMVTELEDNLQNLSAMFPVDINFKITSLKTAISKLQSKKQSFLDEFEPEVKIPEFTDVEYFEKVSEETAAQVREAFKEIEEYQNIAFDKFVRDHPGPYYTNQPEQKNLPTEKLRKLKSMISEDREQTLGKIQEISRKVASFSSVDEKGNVALLGPMKQALDTQQQQMEEVASLYQEISMMLNAEEEKRQKQTGAEEVAVVEIEDPIERVKREAMQLYKKNDDMIEKEASMYNMMASTISSDLDSINLALTGIKLKEESISEVLEKSKVFVDKAKTKTNSLFQNLDNYSNDIDAAKEKRLSTMESEDFISFKERCTNNETECSQSLANVKTIVDDVTNEIDSLTFK